MEVVDQIVFETRTPKDDIQLSKKEINNDYGPGYLPLVQNVVNMDDGWFLVIINIVNKFS